MRLAAIFTLPATSHPAVASGRVQIGRLSRYSQRYHRVINVVTPPAWILEHELIGNEAGKSAIIAQPTAHNAFGSGKKYTASERANERASRVSRYSADQIIEGIGRDRCDAIVAI